MHGVRLDVPAFGTMTSGSRPRMFADIHTRVMRADTTATAAAVRVLAAGGLVAFPTETVYGLGANAANGEAVARLYAAKGRPQFNPLICHVAEASATREFGIFNDDATRLAEAFWPGPLTLVLPRAADCPVASLATAGLDSVALRVPDHQVAHELLHALGRPVVAPSANRSGHVSPTTAGHVLDDLRGRIDLILDGGPTQIGIESTIIACLGAPVLLRSGGLPRAEVERVLGHPLTTRRDAAAHDSMAPVAPGQLVSHYAPRTPLRLDATSIETGEALLAFGPTLPAGTEHAVRVLNLSTRGDLIEAAANLFAHLRALDATRAPAIAVMPVPREGLGEAINDRLTRAEARTE